MCARLTCADGCQWQFLGSTELTAFLVFRSKSEEDPHKVFEPQGLRKSEHRLRQSLRSPAWLDCSCTVARQPLGQQTHAWKVHHHQVRWLVNSLELAQVLEEDKEEAGPSLPTCLIPSYPPTYALTCRPTRINTTGATILLLLFLYLILLLLVLLRRRLLLPPLLLFLLFLRQLLLLLLLLPRPRPGPRLLPLPLPPPTPPPLLLLLQLLLQLLRLLRL